MEKQSKQKSKKWLDFALNMDKKSKQFQREGLTMKQ